MNTEHVLLDEDRVWITRLCKTLGIPLDLDASFAGRDIPWNGRLMTGISGENGLPFPVRDIYHDIAHWVLAEPEMRHHVGFGCGPAPDGRIPEDYDYFDETAARSRRSSEHDGPANERTDEESIASAIGILLQRFVDVEAAIVHAAEHDWLVFTTDQSRAFGFKSGAFDRLDVCYKSLEEFWATLRKVICEQPHGRVAVERFAAAGIDIFSAM